MFTSLTNPSFLGAIFNRLAKGEQIDDQPNGDTSSGAFLALLNAFKLGQSFETHQQGTAKVTSFPVTIVTPHPFLPNQQTDIADQSEDIVNNDKDVPSYFAGMASPFINNLGTQPEISPSKSNINNITGFEKSPIFLDASPIVSQQGNKATINQTVFSKITTTNNKTASQGAIFVPLSEVGGIPATTIIGSAAEQSLAKSTTAPPPLMQVPVAESAQETGTAAQKSLTITQSPALQSSETSDNFPHVQNQLAQPISNLNNEHPLAEETLSTNQYRQVNVAKSVEAIVNQASTVNQQRLTVVARVPANHTTAVAETENTTTKPVTAFFATAAKPATNEQPAQPSVVQAGQNTGKHTAAANSSKIATGTLSQHDQFVDGVLQTQEKTTQPTASKAVISTPKSADGNAVQSIELLNIAEKTDEPIRLQVSTAPFESETAVNQIPDQTARQTKPIKPIAGPSEIKQPRAQTVASNLVNRTGDAKSSVPSPQLTRTNESLQTHKTGKSAATIGNKQFTDPLWENRIAAKQQLLIPEAPANSPESGDVPRVVLAGRVFVKNEIPALQQHPSNQVVDSIPIWQPITSEPADTMHAKVKHAPSSVISTPQSHEQIQLSATGIQKAGIMEKLHQPEASHNQHKSGDALNNAISGVTENSIKNNAQSDTQSQDADRNNLFRPDNVAGKAEKSIQTRHIGERFQKQMTKVADNDNPQQIQQPTQQQVVQEPILREPLKPFRGMTLHEAANYRNERNTSSISHSKTTVFSAGVEPGTIGSNDTIQPPIPSLTNQQGGQPPVATQFIKFQNMAQFTSRLATALQEQVYKLNINPQAAAQQLFIQLEPRDLGVIRLHLRMKDNKLTGKIESGTSETTAMLQTHQPHLVTRLAEMGINIQDFSINYNDQLNAQQQSFRDHAQHQQQSGHSAQSRGRDEASSGKSEQPFAAGEYRQTISKDGVDITM
jgi:flagellar hook-length control protein FliK